MHVLVVEDRPGIAETVGDLLEAAAADDVRVTVARSRGAAVERLLGMEGPAIDCVVLDASRPGGGALDGLAQVRTASLDAPVVVLTGPADDALAVRAVREGAQDVLPLGALEPAALVRALRLAVERRRIEAALVRRALHDALTGLPNRTLFFDRLRQALSRLGRTRTCLAVLFLDLDGFKAVNDTHGHAAGDRMLAEVAAHLAAALRGGDTAARIGGDEFVVLCEDVAGAEEAHGIAERLLAELGHPASMGVALAADGDVDAEALVRAADAAMYAVKRGGGGAVRLALDDAPASTPV
jgi:diguanylate cyclase (GGDEF)-like protein